MTNESLFAAALELPASDRAAYLNDHCPDPAVRRQVEELLAAADASNPLDQRLPDLDLTNPRPTTAGESTVAVGDRVGPYKLLERIGEGGMGEVWVADQLEPIKRRVALKLIKAGMESRSVLGRFEAERQALAVMDHPNIAKVLDAGQTSDGRPFFVMELVKGTPITEFCDARKLTPKQRLELFVPVCQAIQHAHMKGIIHRDIKPSNVLVALHDETPVPKVIDFGVAKAVGQQLTEKTIYTGFGALVGTPTYMAPEQATFNQLDVDTRADVYALGVLLYELLAGSPPIERERLKKAALDEVLRIVRDEEPPRPSQRLSSSETRASIAATRGSEPAKLSALMKGELDWIVMKALEKDRTRRYETANGFAADVQRYLSGEQVQAVPPSLGYRLAKAYRRNKAAVLVSMAFTILLLTGIVTATVLAIQAQRAEKLADEKADEAAYNLGLADEARERAEAARKAAERKANAAAVDLDLKFCEVEPSRGILRLAQRVKTLPPDATELRYFVTLNLFVHAQRLARLVPYRGMLTGVNPDGKVGYRRREDGLAEFVDPITGERLALLAERSDWGAFVFGPEGQLGARVQPDEAQVYDLRTNRLKATLCPGGPHDWFAEFDPTFTRAVVWREKDAGADGKTRRVKYQLWDVDANRRLADMLQLEHDSYDGLVPGDLCVFSPDGKTLLTVGDGQARVWSATDGRLLHTLAGHTADPRFAAFSPDGKTATTGSTQEVQWWRTAEWKPDGPPTRNVIDHPWAHGERPLRLWGTARILADGVLAVAVQHGHDAKDGTSNYLYVRGEPAAHRYRALASDGRVAVDSDGTFLLHPFREWRSADGRRHPRDFNGPEAEEGFLLLQSKQWPDGFDTLIDLACDRPVGQAYFDLVRCQAKGCRFIAVRDPKGYAADLGTVVLPAADAAFDPDTLELWAEVLTCGHLNPLSGFFEKDDEPTWERKRQDLLRRAKSVGQFPFPGAFASDRLHWLREQYKTSDQKLIERLVKEEPTAENYRKRAVQREEKGLHALSLSDVLAAEELDLKAGVPITGDESVQQVAWVLYSGLNSPQDYTMALKYLDTRPNRDKYRLLRGMARYRLGRYLEALDLLLEEERAKTDPFVALAGGPGVFRADELLTLAIGVCLLKQGRSAEASARLEQARARNGLRQPPNHWSAFEFGPEAFFLSEADDEIVKGGTQRERKK